ncbi:MAG: RNA 2',3'-cyclic phosphodiesterase [Arenicellales bacterium]|nr:RNA 2',3'-cyclic phosphodiesterase [Arenicellales bacterium]
MNDPLEVRSFLACWPDKPIAQQLNRCAARIQEQVGGRVIRVENLHVTLAFLGDLMPTQISAVEDVCAPLPRTFRLELDRVGFWKTKGIVWIGPRTPDVEFNKFVENLRDRLRRVGFRIDSRPFTPHITLLRKVRKRPRIVLEALDWVINEYTLVASKLEQDGARYSVSKRWSTLGDVK